MRDAEDKGELTSRTHWERAHRRYRPEMASSSLSRLLLRTLRGERRPGRPSTYSDYVLWERIYSRYLSDRRGRKVIEIGSAPGEHLVGLSVRFGLEPYGVEYSAVGVRLNREMFERCGLDPSRVIEADFMSEDFIRRWRGEFDVVISRGFIEHFTRPAEIIERHIELLRPGGLLVVSVPNLRGLNRLLVRFFEPAALAGHNLDLMRLERFHALFRRDDLEEYLCGYYGVFDVDLFEASGPVREFIRRCAKAMQLVLNVLFRMLFRSWEPTCPLWSPYLIFVGRRRPESSG